MRINPTQHKVKSAQEKISVSEKTTRLVALALAFISVFFFFFKILFF